MSTAQDLSILAMVSSASLVVQLVILLLVVVSFMSWYFIFLKLFTIGRAQRRTELLQSLGFDLGELARRDHVLFVVHSAQIAYHKPALLNDLLTVTARVKHVGRARLQFDQAVMRREEVLASAELSLACVSAKSYRPVAVPEAIRKKLEELR